MGSIAFKKMLVIQNPPPILSCLRCYLAEVLVKITISIHSTDLCVDDAIKTMHDHKGVGIVFLIGTLSIFFFISMYSLMLNMIM